MLAHAVLRGVDKEDYLNPDHPVQVTIRETLAEMVDMVPAEMPLGEGWLFRTGLRHSADQYGTGRGETGGPRSIRSESGGSLPQDHPSP